MLRRTIITAIFAGLNLTSSIVGQTAEKLISEFSKVDRESLEWPSRAEQHLGNYLSFGPNLMINKMQIESIKMSNNEITITLASQRSVIVTSSSNLIATKGIFFEMKQILDNQNRQVAEISEERRSAIEKLIESYFQTEGSDKSSHEFEGIQFAYGRTLSWNILSRYCKLQWE